MGFFDSPLERQIAESVRISRTGATKLLNSKAVYSRSVVPRLSVDKVEEDNLGDTDRNMEEDDVFEEGVEDQETILTAKKLDKTVARQKKKEEMMDMIGWGDIDVGGDENDEAEEELMHFLVKYSNVCDGDCKEECGADQHEEMGSQTYMEGEEIKRQPNQ